MRINDRAFSPVVRLSMCSLLLLCMLYSCGGCYPGKLKDSTAASEDPAPTTIHNEVSGSLPNALLKLQEDPASINTLCVPINGQQVSVLTAAVMLGEDTTVIESLLAQGADIKAADKEKDGILHALVGNRHLADDQKARIVGYFFDLADAGDMRFNVVSLVSRGGRLPKLTPWLEAHKKGDYKTACTIVDRMPDQEAARDGLYYAVQGGLKYTDVGNRNPIRLLLGKAADHFKDKKETPHISEYMGWWEYAWKYNEDVETALCIIKEILRYAANGAGGRTEMARIANLALKRNRDYWGDGWGATQSSEWQRIKEALVSIGVAARDLNDVP